MTLVNETRGNKLPEVLAGSVKPITAPFMSSIDLKPESARATSTAL